MGKVAEEGDGGRWQGGKWYILCLWLPLIPGGGGLNGPLIPGGGGLSGPLIPGGGLLSGPLIPGGEVSVDQGGRAQWTLSTQVQTVQPLWVQIYT